MESLLQFTHVVKNYGKNRVLRDINLCIHAGECVAIVGPNGCGKSTVLRIAAGLTVPRKGKVTRMPCLSMQYMPDAFPRIPLRQEQLTRFIDRIESGNAVAIARLFGMDGSVHTLVRDFSKGMLSKISTVMAFSSHANLLILDEPISGMDELAQKTLIRLAENVLKQGSAVMMACHGTQLTDALHAHVLEIKDGCLNGENPENATESGEADSLCLCSKCDLMANQTCGGRRTNG